MSLSARLLIDWESVIACWRAKRKTVPFDWVLISDWIIHPVEHGLSEKSAQRKSTSFCYVANSFLYLQINNSAELQCSTYPQTWRAILNTISFCVILWVIYSPYILPFICRKLRPYRLLSLFLLLRYLSQGKEFHYIYFLLTHFPIYGYISWRYGDWPAWACNRIFSFAIRYFIHL